MRIKIYRTAHKKLEKPDVIDVCGKFSTTCCRCGLPKEQGFRKVEVAKVPFVTVDPGNDRPKRPLYSRVGRLNICRCLSDYTHITYRRPACDIKD